MTDAVYLSFMPDRHAFGISEDEIEKLLLPESSRKS